MRRKKRQEKGDYSKRVVALILVVALIFSAAVLIAFWHTGGEPATLVSCFFGAVIGELWFLAGIKKKKIRTHAERMEEKPREDERGIQG